MNLFAEMINGMYFIIEILKTYPLELFTGISLIIGYKYKTNLNKSTNFLRSKTGMIVLDGKFGAGKTRFMARIGSEAKDQGIFVLSNFYSGYNFVKWNSIGDLKRLLHDVWTLGELQNFTEDDLKQIYIQDGKQEYKNKLKIRKDLIKKYKYIPHSGYYNRFLFLADEFQNYFFNRGAMNNFAGDNKGLLKLFHQVRHFNSLLILATQSSNELDVKFRRLSTFYINTFEKFGGYIFGYNVFSFVVDKENNLNLEKAVKFTKVPAIKLNGFKVNNIIVTYLRLINGLKKTEDKINNLLKRAIFKPRIITYRFKQLDFQTKYNVNPDIDTYVEGDLFKKINKYYKENPYNKSSNLD